MRWHAALSAIVVRFAFPVLALAACARPAAPSPSLTPAPTGIAAGATTTPGTASADRAPASSDADLPVPDRAQIDRDLAVALGGTLAPDHVGPQAHAEIVARMQAHAEAYAQRLGQLHLAADTDFATHADLFVGDTLARLRPGAPERVRMLAEQLWARYELLLASSTLDERRRDRLRARVPLLRTLAGTIDPSDDPTYDPTWPALEIDRVCSAALPEGHGIRVERTCTCGERPACKVKRLGARLEIEVRRDDTEAPFCRDCYPAWSTCSLPALRPGQTLEVLVDGRAFGSLTANDAGWLAPEVCLSR